MKQGQYRLLTDKDFAIINTHLMKQGGKIVKRAGSIRVDTDGDKTLTQSDRKTSFKNFVKNFVKNK